MIIRAQINKVTQRKWGETTESTPRRLGVGQARFIKTGKIRFLIGVKLYRMITHSEPSVSF